MHSEQPVKVTYVDEVTSEEAVGDIEISHLRLIILISLSAATCSQRSRLDASRLSSTLSTTLYMIYDSSNGTHLLEWVNIQTLGTWSQLTRLQELERSFLSQIEWYVGQDLEAWRWSDYSLRWLQSLTRQSHPWLALSPIYCIRLPFRIDRPDAQHSLLDHASAAQRNATVIS